MDAFPSEKDLFHAETRLALILHTYSMISLNASPEEMAHGHPCGRLIAEAVRVGVYVLAKNLLTKYGMKGEYRLNNNGIILFWQWKDGHLTLRVEGEEALYPKTLPQLRKLIRDKRWDT